MLKVTEDRQNFKYHPIIKRYIEYNLLKHKNILPDNLKVIIFDYISRHYFDDNLTQISKHIEDNKIVIYLNLAQILELYKKGNLKALNRGDLNKDNMPDIKRFKTFLLHALYHELGHFKFGHLYLDKKDLDDNEINQAELDCDNFSLKILGIKWYRQLEFNF